MRRSRNPFWMFHGKQPTEKVDMRFTIPSEFVRLGRAIAIEYECDKAHGGGDGQKAVYRHEFHKDDLLLMDQTQRQLFVLGPRLRVTQAGIED